MVYASNLTPPRQTKQPTFSQLQPSCGRFPWETHRTAWRRLPAAARLSPVFPLPCSPACPASSSRPFSLATSTARGTSRASCWCTRSSLPCPRCNRLWCFLRMLPVWLLPLGYGSLYIRLVLYLVAISFLVLFSGFINFYYKVLEIGVFCQFLVKNSFKVNSCLKYKLKYFYNKLNSKWYKKNSLCMIDFLFLIKISLFYQ